MNRHVMLLTSPHDIFRAYSEGRIGWRQAATLMKLDDFSEFSALFLASGFPLPQPDPHASRQQMDRIDALLYDEDER